MCWAEHTEVEHGVMTDKSVDGFLFVGWIDRDGMVLVDWLSLAKQNKLKARTGIIWKVKKKKRAKNGIKFQGQSKVSCCFTPSEPVRLLMRETSLRGRQRRNN